MRRCLILQETAFQKFASKLATYFQGDMAPEEFAKKMFAHIYANLEDENPLEDVLPRTYKGYFYGQNDITTLAKKIAGSLDTTLFPDFVYSEYDLTIQSLCEAFKVDCLGIDESNYGEKIADYFRSIIEVAAAPKRKKPSTALVKIGEGGNTTVALPTAMTLKDRYGVQLVAEEGSLCPCDGCGKPLFSRVNGQLGLNYDVAVINPQRSENNMNNLIAMCPDCCNKYSIGRNADTMRRIQEIKKKLVDIADVREMVSEQKIEEGIRRVLEKIPSMPKPPNVDLNYDPVTLRKKIEADNILLYIRAQTQVNIYFNVVHGTFQELSQEGLLRFNPFCNQVKITYLNLKDKGYGQERIYKEMVDWLQNGTNEDRGSCEVVISYFIQKCEVFDVITE